MSLFVVNNFKACYVDNVRKAMVWDYSQTTARGSQILYHNSGSFLYTVSQISFLVVVIDVIDIFFYSGCGDSSPCYHCQVWRSPSHHFEGIHLLCPDLSHSC